MADLKVDFAGIAMRNPVTVASGTFGYGPEYAELVDLNRLGAITVKGISVEATEGNPVPRTFEVPGGLMNAIGLQNPGFDGFVEKYMPFLRQYDLPVLVNIWGKTLDAYAEISEKFDSVEGVDGLEVNLSCPNIKEGGISFGLDLKQFETAIRTVRAVTHLPIIIKLSPNAPNIGDFARCAEACGADAISLINTLPAMAINIETRRPRLANVTGGLSGPGIHPVAVKLVYDAAQAVNIPILGMGGIMTAEDAIEMMIAGAGTVAVGTANFCNPNAVIDVIEGIDAYLERHGIKHVSEIVGTVDC